MILWEMKIFQKFKKIFKFLEECKYSILYQENIIWYKIRIQKFLKFQLYK